MTKKFVPQVDGSTTGERVEPSSYERRMNAKNLARSRAPRHQGYFNPVAPQQHQQQHPYHQLPPNMMPNLPPPHAFGGQPVWPHLMSAERFVPPPYQFDLPPGSMFPMPPRMGPMPMRGPPGPNTPRFYRPRF
jgi:hypothetical protein